jgi:preprotein translocase subunit YajC
LPFALIFVVMYFLIHPPAAHPVEEGAATMQTS